MSEQLMFNRWKVISEKIRKNKITYMNCICECGVEKLVQWSHLKLGLSKSCGCFRSDFARSKKIDLLGKKFNRLLVIEEQLEKKCTDAVWKCKCDCGNIINVKATKLKNGRTKSCVCYTRDRIIKAGVEWSRSEEGRKFRSISNSSKIGEKALRWKGGLEEENIRLRYSVESKSWRQKVYERDGFICKHCHIKGKRLNAHHIVPWASNPTLRFSLDNGITLCKDCHIMEHKRVGNPKLKKAVWYYL